MNTTVEPRIQYAKTSDGVDIAFATAGDGPPLLWSYQSPSLINPGPLRLTLVQEPNSQSH